MKTEIKILHSSCCVKGSPIKEQLEQIASKNNLPVVIEELSELQDTMVFGTMTFPSIVVNGNVYDYKALKTEDEIVTILKSE
ncbi:thioredoxin family protein [uncultured Marixanthomonas sp.]|uniref:thioredoxin family protein n=1 Tax=uncultured Marixanthomonas sp. TaxID=757245 RepID=UPI0030DD97DE|tara:strand:- start:103101 stop:103346 length:246 start_codon:yes stop_codon:yes gene_type:complete